MCVCMCVTFVGRLESFQLGSFCFGAYYIKVHLVSRHTKPDKRNSTIFISISGYKCGGGGGGLGNPENKYKMIDIN
jgi:hypothetical protein